MVSKYKILLFIFSILIVIIIVSYANPYNIFLTLTKANSLFIFFAFLVSNLGICTQVLKWKVLLKDVSFKELFPIQLLGITISNFTPGKIGEPIKSLILKMKKGIDVSENLPSIIWERVLDIIVIICLSLFTIQSIIAQSSIFIFSILCISVFVILIFLLFLILYKKSFGSKIFKIVRKFPIFKNLTTNFLETFYKNKISTYRILYSLTLSLTTWLLYGIVVYFSFLALGISLSPLLLTGILTLSIIIGVASSLPGGIGSTDAVMILLLGLIGIENTIAVTGVLVSRFLSLWYSIFLGGLSFIYLSKDIDMKKLLK